MIWIDLVDHIPIRQRIQYDIWVCLKMLGIFPMK